MPDHKRWFIGIPLLLGLALLAVFALRWGFASLATVQADRIMGRLEIAERAGQPELAGYEQALALLNRAEALRGEHPDQSDLRGQLLFWRAVNYESFGPERAAALDAAVDQFRAALKQRPTWPYFWANLAVAKSERGIFDEEFSRAVRLATEYGPWERSLQLQMTRLYFHEGRRMDEDSRNRIVGLMRNAARTQPQRLLSLADDFRQMQLICGLIEDDRYASRCAS